MVLDLACGRRKCRDFAPERRGRSAGWGLCISGFGHRCCRCRCKRGVAIQSLNGVPGTLPSVANARKEWMHTLALTLFSLIDPVLSAVTWPVR